MIKKLKVGDIDITKPPQKVELIPESIKYIKKEGKMTATTPERELRQKLTKLLPSKDCDVCNGLGGWTSETWTTAGMKWVVCDKCHGLPDSELVDSIMALLSTELSAQATAILGEVEEYAGHVLNDGVTGKPMKVTVEKVITDIIKIIKKTSLTSE